jgi:hypothetical protein
MGRAGAVSQLFVGPDVGKRHAGRPVEFRQHNSHYQHRGDAEPGGIRSQSGAIAVQQATRAQLRAEYQVRLGQTTGDAWRIRTDMQEIDAAMREVEARLPELQTGAENAERAYLAGNLPALTYVTLVEALVAQEAEISAYKQSLWGNAIALSTIIGTQVKRTVDIKESMR